jgi:hypothetical protein
MGASAIVIDVIGVLSDGPGEAPPFAGFLDPSESG